MPLTIADDSDDDTQDVTDSVWTFLLTAGLTKRRSFDEIDQQLE